MYRNPLGVKRYEFCSTFGATALPCIDYFCSSTYEQSHIFNKSELVRHVNMHNFCHYCVTQNRTLLEKQQFQQALLSNGSCYHFTPFVNDSCGEGNYPWLHHLFYNISTNGEGHICYCPSMDRYGYKYAIFFA